MRNTNAGRYFLYIFSSDILTHAFKKQSVSVDTSLSAIWPKPKKRRAKLKHPSVCSIRRTEPQVHVGPEKNNDLMPVRHSWFFVCLLIIFYQWFTATCFNEYYAAFYNSSKDVLKRKIIWALEAIRLKKKVKASFLPRVVYPPIT